MKKLLFYIIFLIAVVICGFVINISLFHTALFSNIHVLMYRGVCLIIFTGLILAVMLIIIRKLLIEKRKKHNKGSLPFFDEKDILSAAIVFMCVHLAFFILVPVTVERSVSVFTLSQIENIDGDTITKEDAEKIFIDKFVGQNDAFGKRFDEQIVTGSIKENEDGSFTLTDRGHFLVDMFKMIGTLYNADMKNINE